MRPEAARIARTALIDDPAGLSEINAQWRALAEGRGNAFVTPEWFAAWQRHYGESSDPVVAAAWHEDGSLAGVLPLVRVEGHPASLRFAGASVGDYFHPAAAAENEAAVGAAVAPLLPLGRGGCSLLILDNVGSEAEWCAHLDTAAATPLRAYRTKSAGLTYRDLTGIETWDQFLAERSRNFRRDLRRKLERLEADREVRFRRCRTSAELSDDLDTLFDLHDRRWAQRGGSSSSTPRVRAFLRDFAAAALSRGWLRLWLLDLDGEPVAAKLGWRIGGRVASYQTGFDPALQREGVGFVLAAHMLREAIEEGSIEFNMLLGDEAWKARFGDKRKEVATIALVRRGHPARAAIAAEVVSRRALEILPDRPARAARAAVGSAARMLPTARRR